MHCANASIAARFPEAVEAAGELEEPQAASGRAAATTAAALTRAERDGMTEVIRNHP
jgi:hypothetical protein